MTGQLHTGAQLTQVHVQKVKERFAGKWGTATLQWNDFLSRFEDMEVLPSIRAAA